MQNVRNMTSGNVYKHMLVFAIPLLISQLFQQLYNTADSIIVGRFLGTEALAAVSTSGNLIYLMIAFFDGLSIGAGVVLSREFGKGDRDSVSRVTHTIVTVTLLYGIVLTVFGMLFTPVILRWINTDPEYMTQAVEYFRYYFAGSLGMVLYNALRGIMMAVGDSKRPLYFLIISSCLNVFLDWLFVGVFGWGVWSAAVATDISQITSVILCFTQLCKKGSVISIDLRKLHIYPKEFKEIIKYGTPSGIQQSVIIFSNVIIQSYINSFGMVASAAYGVYLKLEGFILLPIMSLNTAITTFVSQNFGAKEYDRAGKGAKFGITMAVIMGVILGMLYVAFSKQLYSLFTSDERVIALGITELGILAPFYFLSTFSQAMGGVCRGAGKPEVPMAVFLSAWCVIRIIYIIIVTQFTDDIRFIYWAHPITWAISSIAYLIYCFKVDWIHGFSHELNV